MVIILTASMGAGHHRVGTELASRLKARGVSARLVDVSDLLPPGLGRSLTSFYKFMAHRAQPLYEVLFRLQMYPPREDSTLFPLSMPMERRIASLVENTRPALLLSTFHLCSQVAGRMRAAGRLGVPVVSYVLDFFVHGMWVHPGVDSNLLLHGSQTPRLLAAGGRSPIVCGPVVREAFWSGHVDDDDHVTPWVRAEARRALGIGPGHRCVLITGGSWGVGDVAKTMQAIMAVPEFVPVVITGDNRRLRQELQLVAGSRSLSPKPVVLGWVEDMDRLMAAADVMVENAGGLTAMEAMAAGLPVVTHAPIAGHGRANAEEMARAGVSVFARDETDLVGWVKALSPRGSQRRRLVRQARSMFQADADAASLLALWARTGVIGGQKAPQAFVDLTHAPHGSKPRGSLAGAGAREHSLAASEPNRAPWSRT